jgi:hypothetical protein
MKKRKFEETNTTTKYTKKFFKTSEELKKYEKKLQLQQEQLDLKVERNTFTTFKGIK